MPFETEVTEGNVSTASVSDGIHFQCNLNRLKKKLNELFSNSKRKGRKKKSQLSLSVSVNFQHDGLSVLDNTEVPQLFFSLQAVTFKYI